MGWFVKKSVFFELKIKNEINGMLWKIEQRLSSMS